MFLHAKPALQLQLPVVSPVLVAIYSFPAHVSFPAQVHTIPTISLASDALHPAKIVQITVPVLHAREDSFLKDLNVSPTAVQV